jgi:hypothetical protein
MNEVVICPNCDHIQEETGAARAGDKFAWACRRCGSIVENGKPFLLDTVLDETHYRTSPMCCFGCSDKVYYNLRNRFVSHDWRYRGIRRLD